MKISVHAARELEHALKAAADDAMSVGDHEIDLDVIESSEVITKFVDELVQARAQRDAQG